MLDGWWDMGIRWCIMMDTLGAFLGGEGRVQALGLMYHDIGMIWYGRMLGLNCLD